MSASSKMTMKRREKRKFLRTVVLGGLQLSVGDAAVEGADNGHLRRHRFQQPSEPIDGTASTHDFAPFNGAMAKMEDLWSEAAATAQVELDTGRMLWLTRSSQDLSMSMQSRPPTGPSPGPGPGPAPVPTPVPPTGDCLQGRTREEYIYDLLVVVTAADLLNDPSTPQGMAFDYLANEDPYLEDPCVSSTIEQRFGLTTMYYSLTGQEWVLSDGWLGQDQECLWYGIECSGGDPNEVTRLTLASNNLAGRLPDEIKTLDMLERMDLYSNAVTGSLPTTISDLSRLILLDVEQNILTGLAFPPQLYNVRSLLAYRASDNLLSGSISADIAGLNNLQQVWLATNQLTGSIPTELGACSDLESVFLYTNQMVGTIPTELGSLIKLEDLRLYENLFESTIPLELFGATSLQSLRLEQNVLSGTIPTQIGALTLMTDLQLDTNVLSGSLPSEIGNLSSLVNLIINNNFLSGQIPNVFEKQKQLDFVDASNNQFMGTIPESIFAVPSIRLVYLSNNTLTGSIPPEYSKPSLLRDLYLDGNGLVGTVPEPGAGELGQLNEFLLQFNFLSGSMPSFICDLRAGGGLEDLFSDCGGSSPEITCEFPGCCNRCFEGGDLETSTTTTRRVLVEKDNGKTMNVNGHRR